jgi:hypothetical protein
MDIVCTPVRDVREAVAPPLVNAAAAVLRADSARESAGDIGLLPPPGDEEETEAGGEVEDDVERSAEDEDAAKAAARFRGRLAWARHRHVRATSYGT